MFDAFKKLLSIFNDQKVKYLIVGGYAVSFHAQPRATKDIDLLIKPDAENGKAVYAALAKFGMPLEGLTPADFIEREKFFRLGRAPVMATETRTRGLAPRLVGAPACVREMGVELVCRTRLRRPRHLQALHPTTGLLLGQQNRYALEESPQEAT